ncbi:MAG: hypothetical protein IJO88_01145 [Oscillospiraceae bacterium]|nr:hypothetical protein [Oscillospiraceae bacterium]
MKAGEHICPLCATVFTKRCYRGGGNKYGVILQKNILGRMQLKLCGFGSEVDSAILKDLKVIPGKGRSSDRIKIGVKGQTEEIWYRVCPNCGQYHMPFGDEKLPTYVFSVIGSRGQGKSVYLHKLNTDKALQSVNDCRDDFMLHTPYRWTDEKDKESGLVEIPRNNIKDLGKSFILVLRRIDENGKRTGVANLVFRDFPGEAFDSRKAIDENLAEFLRASDALFFVSGPDQDTNGTCNTIYREVDGADEKLTAFILTHLDQISRGEHDNRYRYTTTMDDEGKEVALLTPESFPLVRENDRFYYTREPMEKRMSAQNDIAHRKFEVFGALGNDPSKAGFLVQSCRENNASPERPYWDESRNVYDPVLWVLHKLGLINI